MFAPINTEAVLNAEIIPAVEGKKIRVTRYAFALSSQTTAGFNSNETPITGRMGLTSQTLYKDHDHGGLFATNTGEALNIVLNDETEICGYLTYELDD